MKNINFIDLFNDGAKDIAKDLDIDSLKVKINTNATGADILSKVNTLNIFVTNILSREDANKAITNFHLHIKDLYNIENAVFVINIKKDLGDIVKNGVKDVLVNLGIKDDRVINIYSYKKSNYTEEIKNYINNFIN